MRDDEVATDSVEKVKVFHVTTSREGVCNLIHSIVRKLTR